LLWRMNRKRLEIEAWRDSMLAVSGLLNDSLSGPAIELDQLTNDRRTLYSRVGREEQPDLLKLFDFPPPTNHSPARDVTTTPLQQLFVFNSSFVDRISTAVTATSGNESSAIRIRTAYQQLFQRLPTESEEAIGRTFLTNETPERWSAYVKSLLSLNEFLFVD